MRRILTFHALILFALCYNNSPAEAQVYSYSEANRTYTDLAGAQIITQGTVWNDTTIQVPLGFNFLFFSEMFNSVFIHSNGEAFFNANPTNITVGDTFKRIQIFSTDLIDRGYGTINSQSRISYKTEGAAGSRIFKLEWKNAGFNSDTTGNNPSPQANRYINFQLWLFESNGDIEIAIGPNSGSLAVDEIHAPVVGLGEFYAQSVSNWKILKGSYITGTSGLITIPPEPDTITYPLESWPFDRTVYQLGFDRDITLTPLPTLSQLDSGILGHTIYKDNEWGERFIVSEPAVIKGIVCLNYGISRSEDSASFSIYSVGQDSLPNQKLNSRKIPYRCLGLNHELNYIAFDSLIVIKGAFYATFGLTPYQALTEDTLGLLHSVISENSATSGDTQFGRTVARWFDGNWYDIYSTGYISNKIESSDRGKDLIHLALAPIVNFNKVNTTPLFDSLHCRSATGMNPYVQKGTLKMFPCYPNPAEDYTLLSFSTIGEASMDVKVFNSNGSVVYTRQMNVRQQGTHQHRIPTVDFPPGHYFYLLSDGKNILSSDFVILR